jgi:hypothetical protein
MRRITPLRRGLVITLAVLSNACYSYSSTGLGSATPPDTRIAASLTTRATVNLEGRLGPDVERVEGVLSRMAGDSVEMRLQRTLNRRGEWMTWGGESVRFGPNDFASVGQRRFSRGRTVLAVGAFAALVVLGLNLDLIGLPGSGRSTDPRPIPPVNPG